MQLITKYYFHLEKDDRRLRTIGTCDAVTLVWQESGSDTRSAVETRTWRARDVRCLAVDTGVLGWTYATNWRKTTSYAFNSWVHKSRAPKGHHSSSRTSPTRLTIVAGILALYSGLQQVELGQAGLGFTGKLSALPALPYKIITY